MRAIAEVIALLLAYYVTFGIMATGFGMMAAGSEGAAAAGRFFFVRPLQWAGQQLYFLGIGWIAASCKFLLHRIVDPFILGIERIAIWLATRERGWLGR